MSEYERRDFLKKLGVVGAGALLAPHLSCGGRAGSRAPVESLAAMTLRSPPFALGGHAVRQASDEEAQRIVDEALARRVNFFDNAWDYHGGKSEDLMGKMHQGKARPGLPHDQGLHRMTPAGRRRRWSFWNNR